MGDVLVDGTVVGVAAGVLGLAAVLAIVAWRLGVRATEAARRAEEEAKLGLRMIRETRRALDRLEAGRPSAAEEDSAQEPPRGSRAMELTVEALASEAEGGRPAKGGVAPEAPQPDELLREAGSEDPLVRAAAVGRLRDRAGAEPTLLRALKDEYPQVRRAAIRALEGTGDLTAIRAVIDVVDHDPSAEVRAEALEALASSLSAGSHGGATGDAG